jgi:hypothetical protein
MLPPIQYHSFEVRLVKCQDGYGFFRLSKDQSGVYYFISKKPIHCNIDYPACVEAFLKLLKEASELPILNFEDIK